jgi:thiamine-phosphate pyrophosphorylase
MEKHRQKLRTALNLCPVYAILDSTTLIVHPMDKWLSTVAQAGARIVQLRLKEAPEAYFRHSAKQFVEICTQYNVISIINDKIDVALDLGAGGVHLGTNDELITDARVKSFRHPKGGASFIIGGSARTIERAKVLAAAGATYLGCGACFHTSTKPDAEYIGLERLASVVSSVNIPVIGIGGINWQNYQEVLKTGAAGFAAISIFLGDLTDIALNISLARKADK